MASDQPRNLDDADDRRSDQRSPPEVEPTFVWVSVEERIEARVIDESPGGLGVVVPNLEPFEIGFQVRVELKAGGKRTARIVYTKEVEAGYRIGLEWE